MRETYALDKCCIRFEKTRMNEFGLNFHHYGLAVQKDTEALIMLEGLGYINGENIYDPEQDVHVRLCTHPNMPTVEIVSKGKEDGPLKNILKRGNEMLYHSCYETENLEITLRSISNKGLRALPVSPRKKAILFGGKFVSFYYILGFGLIEILES